jgi:hypothetical protein
MGQCDELKNSQTRKQSLATLTHIGLKNHVAMGFNGPIVRVTRKGFEEILKDEICFDKHRVEQRQDVTCHNQSLCTYLYYLMPIEPHFVELFL